MQHKTALLIHQAAVMCSETQVLLGRAITFSSDSKVAVAWVNGSGFGSLKNLNLIYDIRDMLCFLGNAEVIYSPRASNTFADSLAKRGSKNEGDLVVWYVH